MRYYFVAWLPFVAVYALAVRLSGSTWADSLLSGVGSVSAAAVLGLGVQRFMPSRARYPSRWPALLHHAVLGTAYAAAWTGVIAAQIRFGAPAQLWTAFLQNAIRWQFITGLILYALLVAAFSVRETNARLREQEQRASREEALRIAAELQALRAQLNPHFIFNTLHSITALVRSDPARAEAALERLAACLRHVLELNTRPREEISLGDELAFVRDYLALERMRHGDRLLVVEEVDPDALDAPVLAFVLQPLVENAIRHGLSPVSRPVTIRIAAFHDATDALLLEVADDGAGAPAPAQETGVGLRAIRQRLLARYGDAAQLLVTTAPGEGCRVVIRIPATAPVAR